MIFSYKAINDAVFNHGLIVKQGHVCHAAIVMACVDIGFEQGILLCIGNGLAAGGDDIVIGAPDPLLRF